MKKGTAVAILGMAIYTVALFWIILFSGFLGLCINMAFLGTSIVFLVLGAITRNELLTRIHKLELDLSAQQQIISKMYSKLYPKYHHRRHR